VPLFSHILFASDQSTTPPFHTLFGNGPLAGGLLGDTPFGSFAADSFCSEPPTAAALAFLCRSPPVRVSSSDSVDPRFVLGPRPDARGALPWTHPPTFARIKGRPGSDLGPSFCSRVGLCLPDSFAKAGGAQSVYRCKLFPLFLVKTEYCFFLPLDEGSPSRPEFLPLNDGYSRAPDLKAPFHFPWTGG